MQAEVWQWSVAKRDLLSGSFAGPKRIYMEFVSNGRGRLAWLSSIRTRLMPVARLPCLLAELNSGRPGSAPTRLRSRSIAIISSNGN
jgi:hypothetical protein